MAPLSEDEAVDEWVDLMDGKMRKRIVVPGTAPGPEMEQDVVCSFSVSLKDDRTHRVLQNFTNVRYRIGEGEAVPVLELCLRHMLVGEECVAESVSNFAWGPIGCPALEPGEEGIPTGADVRLNIVLHSCLPQNSEGNWELLLEEAAWRKSNGNDHFRRRELTKAAKCYVAGIKLLEHKSAPEDAENSEAFNASADRLVTDCGANLAAVFLEQGDALKAKDAATAALEVDPDHLKGLYRAAKACFLLDEFVECEAALQRAQGLEPENPGVARLYAELRRKKKEYTARSKRVATKVFGETRGQDGTVTEAEQEAEQEAGGTAIAKWMPTRWHVAALVIAGCLMLLAGISIVVPEKHRLPACMSVVLGAPVLAVCYASWNYNEVESQI
mmetsp:Transcript_4038/g.9470  ORF Transcript_4038/g.9470 Transcript_4038/m.9470 type:complete len:386 (-) Transcript_4038:28-1185(-)